MGLKKSLFLFLTLRASAEGQSAVTDELLQAVLTPRRQPSTPRQVNEVVDHPAVGECLAQFVPLGLVAVDIDGIPLTVAGQGRTEMSRVALTDS